jgi:hypothetical protein
LVSEQDISVAPNDLTEPLLQFSNGNDGDEEDQTVATSTIQDHPTTTINCDYNMDTLRTSIEMPQCSTTTATIALLSLWIRFLIISFFILWSGTAVACYGLVYRLHTV